MCSVTKEAYAIVLVIATMILHRYVTFKNKLLILFLRPMTMTISCNCGSLKLFVEDLNPGVIKLASKRLYKTGSYYCIT